MRSARFRSRSSRTCDDAETGAARWPGLWAASLWSADAERRLIALAVPLVIYLGAALLYDPGKLRLSAIRTLSPECVLPGKPVVVKVAITNHGPRLEELRVEDSLPPSLERVEGEARVLTTLKAGETIELEYTLRGKRGGYSFGDVRVTANDALGLFRRRGRISAAAHLLILPEVQQAATRGDSTAEDARFSRSYSGSTRRPWGEFLWRARVPGGRSVALD